ncbi:hypothetical protein MTO96_026828 [Rhipicephalus appendiculatus]
MTKNSGIARRPAGAKRGGRHANITAADLPDGPRRWQQERGWRLPAIPEATGINGRDRGRLRATTETRHRHDGYLAHVRQPRRATVHESSPPMPPSSSPATVRPRSSTLASTATPHLPGRSHVS